MFKDAPPSRELVTISLTWRELVEVNTLTNSGITAPASVPQLMIVASFHQREGSPARSGIIIALMPYVRTIERIEVSHTRLVRGASKSILSALPYFAFANAPLTK